MKIIAKVLLPLFLAAGMSHVTHAEGVPVFDAENLLQQIEQLKELEEQLSELKSIYGQAQQIYGAFSQITDIAKLLKNTAARKYLPAEYQQILSELAEGQAKWAALTNDARVIRDANRIIDPMKDAPPDMQHALELQILEQQGLQAAQFAATAHQNLKASEQRLTVLEDYIDRLKTAKDPKETLDLQAAIASEQLFLQNETIKMLALIQASQAQQMLNDVKEEEARHKFISDLSAGLNG